MELLLQLKGIGCGHINLIMKNETISGITIIFFKKIFDIKETPNQLIQWFLTAFYEYMWLEDSMRSPLDKKLLYIVLQVIY